MSQQVAYFPLGGGLDLATPAISAKPGTARAALNYESDLTGFRRVSGYERFDGQTSPTDAYNDAPDATQGAIDRDAARAAITTVPGSGPVRGVQYYDDALYAWRDDVTGTKGVMHKSSAAGWVEVSDQFPPGGAYEFVVYNFIGSTSGVRLYGVNGVGQGFQFDGTVVTFISTGMVTDIPTKIAAHKKHLFFAFAGGSVQHSGLGDPLTWTAVTGAAEIAVGDEITDLQTAAPNVLVILAKNSISVLHGHDASDWQLEVVTNEAGALANTVQKIGPVIYMDNRGIRSLGTTSAYGDFTLGTMTQMIAPLLRAKLNNAEVPVASVRVRTRDLYRVFFADGTGISVYLGKKIPEVMPIDLAVPITCACSAETSNSVEKIWFGTDDGYVYQMDKGRSFDGEELSYHLRLPFNHHGSPHTIKRWHRVALEYDAASNATLTITGEVDYAANDEPSMAAGSVPLAGGGGFWDAVSWDEFFWSAPVEGQEKVYIDAIGQNLSLLIGGTASDEEPHTLQGMTMFYSVRGLVR